MSQKRIIARLEGHVILRLILVLLCAVQVYYRDTNPPLADDRRAAT